ncbi:MAG: hypothetical protein Q9M91_03110 [Candidatus Dojkabacteria bacterium]|nr:hypothetical protein [Candidatus Dojkabacteria bacterium]MDQ7020813.1 hypothetical protein [Candidatus Dojkabacteria bacterium]
MSELVIEKEAERSETFGDFIYRCDVDDVSMIVPIIELRIQERESEENVVESSTNIIFYLTLKIL